MIAWTSPSSSEYAVLPLMPFLRYKPGFHSSWASDTVSHPVRTSYFWQSLLNLLCSDCIGPKWSRWMTIWVCRAPDIYLDISMPSFLCWAAKHVHFGLYCSTNNAECIINFASDHQSCVRKSWLQAYVKI